MRAVSSPTKEPAMKQFSKRIAVMHWLIVLLFIIALYLGHQLADTPNSADKLSLFPIHFLIGDLILLLTLLRIYFRKRDGEPAAANANPLLNKLAGITHVLLNLVAIAVAVSGAVTALSSGVINAVKAGDPALIPDFEKVAAHEFHELFIGVFVALVVFHVAAALYHQFIVKDQLLRRIMIKRFPD